MTTVTATRDSTQDIAKQVDDNTIYNIPGGIYKGNTPLAEITADLFDFKWSDHELNDLNWLRTDTFSWNDGTVYTNAYNHLVNELNEVKDVTLYAWKYSYNTYYTKSETPSVGDDVYYSNGYSIYSTVNAIIDETQIQIDSYIYTRDSSSDISDAYKQTETIGSYTINYYPALDGHKIVLDDQEGSVNNIYIETGVAWYYVLDTTNRRFKLPRTKYGFNGLRTDYLGGVGNYIKPGLPNIEGYLKNISCGDGVSASGAFSIAYTQTSGVTSSTSASNKFRNIQFSAYQSGVSNQIYGNSNTVQPPATQMYLYCYVGNFSQSATEQTAGLNASLFNGKADVDLSNSAPNASTSAKETIVGWGIPDYTTAVSVSGSSFTATYKCWIVGVSNNSGTTEQAIYVNSVLVARESGDYADLQIPLDVGDIVTTNSGNIGQMTICAMKGL